MDTYDPKPFVAAGVILLDAREPKWAKAPRWHHEIKLDELDMSEPCDCVLGQLYSDYRVGLQELDINDTKVAEYLGFNIPDGPDELRSARYAALAAAWTEVVTERLAAQC